MRPSFFRSWIPAAAAALAVFGSTAAVAADSAASWPHQPVTMILGFPAGSGVDVIARGVQEPLSQRLGQPLIIDYKSGAAGNIASEIDRKSTRLNSSHLVISYAVFCLKKKNKHQCSNNNLQQM